MANTPLNQAPWRTTAPQQAIAALDLENFAPTSDLNADVIVIGGGVSGLSAAASCAQMGAKTVLLERADTLGAGASGRNAGIMCGGVNMPLTHLQPGTIAEWLWVRTTQLLLELFQEAEKQDSPLLGRQTGSLFLAKTSTAARRLQGEVKAFAKIGLEAQLFSAADVARRTRQLLNVADIAGALYLPAEGRMHPLTLLAYLRGQAITFGASLYGSAQVEQWHYSSIEKQWRLTLASGRVATCRNLIRCTGPLVEPNSRIYAMTFQLELPEDFPVFQDAAPYTYYDYRPGEGCVTISGGRYGRAADAGKDPAYHANMAKAAKYWLPALEESAPAFQWAVDLKVAADMIPGLIPLTGGPGFSIEGLGALGVLPGIALGQLAAQKLLAPAQVKGAATAAP